MSNEDIRRQGRFFTPEWAVHDLHKRLGIEQSITTNTIVFDPAAGHGALYNGLKGDVVASTLLQEEADEATRLTGHKTYVGDFLSGTLHPEVYDRLEAAAAAGKRLLVISNPPYATSGESDKQGSSKAGVADTEVRKQMHADKLGPASKQLYAQFMYGINAVIEGFGFTDYTVAVFSGMTFVTSDTYSAFREYWYSRYSIEQGWICKASDFHPALSNRWGIGLHIWQKGTTTSVQLQPVGVGAVPIEYTLPATTATGNTYQSYAHWNADAVIYAMTNNSNNCTAMRKVMYKGTEWTIDNHFFWKSREEAEELYKYYPLILADLQASTHVPYVAELLLEPSFYQLLSQEAWAVLGALDELHAAVLPLREGYAMTHPKEHLLAWDAGLYQLNRMAKRHAPTELELLKEAVVELSNKMRPGVYAYGFLR